MSDQPSLKLVVSAEIQICRTGVLRTDHEARFVLILEFDFEFAAAAFDFEIVLVADFAKPVAQGSRNAASHFF